jgi:glycosyltransferase involved in cell wall biosynthesis
LPEVLGDGALLVEPEDRDGLDGALDSCFDDEQLRSRLIAAGESWVGRFSWTRCGAELEQLYRDARRAD